MPEHSSFLTLILAHFRETLEHNTSLLGQSIVAKTDPTWQSFEPLAASILVATLVVLMSLVVRARLSDTKKALIPEDRLTLRTFAEAFLAFVYDTAKSAMDAGDVNSRCGKRCWRKQSSRRHCMPRSSPCDTR